MYCHVENQISVKLDPSPESLSRLAQTLASQRISSGPLHAEEELGEVRFTAGAHRRAQTSLVAMGFAVRDEQVLAIEPNGSKGKLAELTSALARSGIAIDYIYSELNESAAGRRLILKVSNVPLAVQLARSIHFAV